MPFLNAHNSPNDIIVAVRVLATGQIVLMFVERPRPPTLNLRGARGGGRGGPQGGQ